LRIFPATRTVLQPNWDSPRQPSAILFITASPIKPVTESETPFIDEFRNPLEEQDKVFA
jgi:hypothetical protein